MSESMGVGESPTWEDIDKLEQQVAGLTKLVYMMNRNTKEFIGDEKAMGELWDRWVKPKGGDIERDTRHSLEAERHANELIKKMKGGVSDE